METNFTCYTKKLQGETIYFVKKFIVLPEYSNVPPMLEAFGMHADFDKACAIAQLTDAAIKKQLLDEVESGLKQAKVIDLADVNFNKQRPAVGL
jgi:hypothetical protein